MHTTTLVSERIITKAESFPGVRAGIARLEEVLQAPSYQAAPKRTAKWPPEARSVLVIGLKHPMDAPHLDWWEGRNTQGNRRLREIAEALKHWLREEYRLAAYPLPYHVEKGGLFLKDAAVLAGLGIIGRNNLFLHPQWGPQIRLRSVLLEGELKPGHVIEDFAPCKTCDERCHNVCPQHAFSTGIYSRSRCMIQMTADEEQRVPGQANDETGAPQWVTRYCRACELICPVGQQRSVH